MCVRSAWKGCLWNHLCFVGWNVKPYSLTHSPQNLWLGWYWRISIKRPIWIRVSIISFLKNGMMSVYCPDLEICCNMLSLLHMLKDLRGHLFFGNLWCCLMIMYCILSWTLHNQCLYIQCLLLNILDELIIVCRCVAGDFVSNQHSSWERYLWWGAQSCLEYDVERYW